MKPETQGIIWMAAMFVIMITVAVFIAGLQRGAA
jgi:hypothetical protein